MSRASTILTLSEAGMGLLCIDQAIESNKAMIRDLMAEKDEILQLIALLHSSNQKLSKAAPNVGRILREELR